MLAVKKLPIEYSFLKIQSIDAFGFFKFANYCGIEIGYFYFTDI